MKLSFLKIAVALQVRRAVASLRVPVTADRLGTNEAYVSLVRILTVTRIESNKNGRLEGNLASCQVRKFARRKSQFPLHDLP